MVISKIPFVDDRVTHEQWLEMKPKTPLGSLPVADLDGKEVVQSSAILRYIGKLGGLYPEDDMDALFVDQVIDTCQDFYASLMSYRGTDKSRLQSEREKALANGGERYWGGCQRMIEDYTDSGPYVLGEKLSIADLVIAGMYILLRFGFLEHVPKKALDGYERMKKVYDAVIDIPEVREYYNQHPVTGI